jgi:inner membrane transporter RhtA
MMGKRGAGNDNAPAVPTETRQTCSRTALRRSFLPATGIHSKRRSMKKDSFLPNLAAFVALISVQVGAAFAKTIFPLVGSDGVAALRVGIAAILLGATLRPWTLRVNKSDWVNLLGYGGILGLMNVLIYRAFAYIPVGAAISIEVVGPLGVALIASRRKLDLLWVALALGGLALLPLGALTVPLDPRGIVFALAAALCWALYVLIGRAVAGLDARGVAAGMAFASLVVVPLGIVEAGRALLRPQVLALGVAVAALSSIVPYLLDIYALKHLPRSAFGVLMSASPAVSAIAGLLILDETLSSRQWAGIVAITIACAGSALLSTSS